MSNLFLSNMDNIGEVIKTISEKLVPNLLSFVVQFLSFLVLLLVFFLLAYKPVKRILKNIERLLQRKISIEIMDLFFSK